MISYSFKPGELNSICDVAGVQVGHCTLNNGPIQTGVTVIIPARGNLFEHKLVAAVHVINGFGKAAGLMQIEELGQLETPIALTNTFSVGAVDDALVRYAIEQNPEIGRRYGSVNPVVEECYDGHINDIRLLAVKPEHVNTAIRSASTDFARGSVGAGRGMICLGLKGGIGTASARIDFPEVCYHLGVLVLTNYGRAGRLLLEGKPLPEKARKAIEAQAEALYAPKQKAAQIAEQGSIIVILATDAPLCHRQLKRVLRRAQNGIALTGGFTGNGSGEVVIGFSTTSEVPFNDPDKIVADPSFNSTAFMEEALEAFFEAVTQTTYAAILDSLYSAAPVTAYTGVTCQPLSYFLNLD